MLTAAMVGVVAHAAVDGLPWTVAFALGRSSPSRMLRGDDDHATRSGSRAA